MANARAAPKIVKLAQTETLATPAKMAILSTQLQKNVKLAILTTARNALSMPMVEFHVINVKFQEKLLKNKATTIVISLVLVHFTSIETLINVQCVHKNVQVAILQTTALVVKMDSNSMATTSVLPNAHLTKFTTLKPNNAMLKLYLKSKSLQKSLKF